MLVLVLVLLLPTAAAAAAVAATAAVARAWAERRRRRRAPRPGTPSPSSSASRPGCVSARTASWAWISGLVACRTASGSSGGGSWLVLLVWVSGASVVGVVLAAVRVLAAGLALVVVGCWLLGREWCRAGWAHRKCCGGTRASWRWGWISRFKIGACRLSRRKGRGMRVRADWMAGWAGWGRLGVYAYASA
ncbi:hypothetical protein AOQ84DRAFT_118940 [Glonium stellatum]|uniref:Secreted protein n=1 Tax=Glonium stellatum TaxID=574774 RepID=A0A8E2JPA0_9PEZI|nr:hypothetical protein AOQ84DRAFT_118940 [Glonium stellatum]